MRTRSAFTLLEVLLVVTLISLLSTVIFVWASTSMPTRIEDQARRFAQELRAARATAIAQADMVLVEVEPGGEEGGPARYRTQVDSSTQGSEAKQWVELLGGVQFAPGAVSKGPLGDTATTLDTAVAFQCDATGSCAFDGATAMTFFFSHPEQPHIVHAVSIGEHGSVRSYRWVASKEEWQ